MGEKAYKNSSKEEIVNILLTSFMEDSYYEKASDRKVRLADLISSEKDKKFVAKAAIFARNEFGMRSVTHQTAAEIAKHVKGETWTKQFYDQVVFRVDDILEILAIYMKQSGKPLPNSLKRGLARAFNKFDEYQLSKYRGENKEITLIDAVNLLHPKPTEKNKVALKKLMAGKLVSKNTWEAKLTKAGQEAKTEKEKEELKAEAWEELLTKKKLGYLAALRNCRNIIEQSPDSIPKLVSLLTDKEQVEKSMVLPFQFATAYKEVEKLSSPKPKINFESDGKTPRKVLEAIEKAVELSIENIPKLPGKTVILTDNSGSMTGDAGGDSLISAMSKTNTATIANMFATMYWSKCKDTYVGLFGDRLIQAPLDRDSALFENFKKVQEKSSSCGGSTEEGIYTAFENLIRDNTMVDRIVIFSDCQIGDGATWYDHKGRSGWGSFQKLYHEYKRINPKVRIYSIDLKGHGTNVFGDDIIKLSGWSEKIFQLMKIAEQDRKALIHKIDQVPL